MTLYECSKCMKTFNKKSSYDCHITRKFSCVKTTEDENKCINCNKLYSTKYNLKIHMNTCNNRIEIDNKLQIEELKQMVLEQQKNNEELKKKVNELSHVTETNNNINVFPNPSNGSFSIILPEKNADIIITNILGQVVYSANQINGRMNIYLDSKGVYLMRIKLNDQYFTRKIVIN